MLDNNEILINTVMFWKLKLVFVLKMGFDLTFFLPLYITFLDLLVK